MTGVHYQYRAVDARGASHAGVIESASRATALELLATRGLIPVEVQEKGTGELSRAPSWRRVLSTLRQERRSISARTLQSFTQSLSSLLTAGLTIDRALQISGSLTPAGPVRELTLRLLAAVRAGRSFREALAESGEPLPAYYLSMVEAGEVGGALPETMSRVAELLRRSIDIQERVRSALIYPALLAVVVLTTLVVLLTFVLPRFEVLFAESEAPLPWSTQAVLLIGRLVADFWWVGLGALVAAAIGARIWIRRPEGRARLHRWLIRSRLTLGLPLTLNAARFFRTISTLLRNGATLPVALRVARGSLSNEALNTGAEQATQAVQAGQPLSEALAAIGLFPPVAVQLARVGEETGHLDDLLLSAATLLEEESYLKIERLITLLVPLLTIGMGLIVAGLIGSVLIGLLSINDLAF
jgi:general secretion pathway protein F